MTEGIATALARATEAAGGKDVRLGGGVATIRQYLDAQLIDEMRIAMSPVLLGSGQSLFENLDLPALGYQCSKHVATPSAAHFILTRSK